VAGTITLSSELTIKSAFLTVDGLTAPSPGITLNGRGFIIRGPGGHDIVLRGLRVRNAWPKDGIWITDAAYRVVLDHLSVHNSADGNLDITRTNTRDIAVCNSIFAQPAGEEKNSLLAFGSTRMTFYHNLFVSSQQRNPQVTFDDSSAKTQDLNTTLDLRNNLMWDWRGGYGTRIRYGAKANVVNNYYWKGEDALLVCKGAGAPSECNGSAPNLARAYVNGNVNVANSLSTEYGAFAAPFVPPQDAKVAACTVLTTAGVRPLDAIDTAYVARVKLTGCP
jgi:pectate lyase